METSTCPHCARTDRQLKIGQNPSGSRRYRCCFCQRTYTPHPNERGYAQTIRRQALGMYVDGMHLRRIARHLGIVHQTVANWVAAHAATLPDLPPLAPAIDRAHPLPVVELDELYTFESVKKARLRQHPDRPRVTRYHRI